MGKLTDYIFNEINENVDYDLVWQGIEKGLDNYLEDIVNSFSSVSHTSTGSITPPGLSPVPYVDTIIPTINYLKPSEVSLGNTIKNSVKNLKTPEVAIPAFLNALDTYFKGSWAFTCSGNLTINTGGISAPWIYTVVPLLSSVSTSIIGQLKSLEIETMKTAWNVLETNILPLLNANIAPPPVVTGSGSVPAGVLTGIVTPIPIIFN